MVDNEVAVNNIKKMTAAKGIPTTTSQLAEDRYQLTLTIDQTQLAKQSQTEKQTTTYLFGRQHFGEGDPELGSLLMKSYIYSLTELPEAPTQLIFFNSGVFLTKNDSQVLADLHTLEDKGTAIYACGTCLDFYGLKEQLAIGEITNMYAISEMQQAADKAITV